MTSAFTLYSYYRSSASYRVRIALNIKGIPYTYKSVNLIKDGGGEQNDPEYTLLNPLAQVPCLIHNNQPITQSMAIISYLDDISPAPTLFPDKALDRAVVIQICEMINSGIQPLQNTSVTGLLAKEFHFTEDQKAHWLKYWIEKGLRALESTLKQTAGEFCFGDTLTAADCFLAPQVFSSKRFGVDASQFKKINEIYSHISTLEPFIMAEPSRQPDAVQ